MGIIDCGVVLMILIELVKCVLFENLKGLILLMVRVLLLFSDNKSVLLVLFIGDESVFDGKLFLILCNVSIILLFVEWCWRLIKFLYSNYFIELFGYSWEVLIIMLDRSVLFVVSCNWVMVGYIFLG